MGARPADASFPRSRTCPGPLVPTGRDRAGAALPNGTRSLDQPGDCVRRELAAALAPPDLAVLPALVDGATMPAPEFLPADIAGVTKLSAADLRNKRRREDVRALGRIVKRYDPWWRRSMRRVRNRPARAGLLLQPCGDFNSRNGNVTITREQAAYQLAALYCGWDFSLSIDPGDVKC